MQERVLNVLVGEVEVAAQSDLERIPNLILQARDDCFQYIAIVMVAFVGVRRGDHVCDAVGRGTTAHLNRDVPGLRPVIDFRKNVRVYVDHNDSNTASLAMLL